MKNIDVPRHTSGNLKNGVLAQAHPRGGGASTYTIPSGMVVRKPSAEAAAATDAEQNAPPPTLQPGGKDGFVFMMHTHAWCVAPPIINSRTTHTGV